MRRCPGQVDWILVTKPGIGIDQPIPSFVIAGLSCFFCGAPTGFVNSRPGHHMNEEPIVLLPLSDLRKKKGLEQWIRFVRLPSLLLVRGDSFATVMPFRPGQREESFAEIETGAPL